MYSLPIALLVTNPPGQDLLLLPSILSYTGSLNQWHDNMHKSTGLPGEFQIHIHAENHLSSFTWREICHGIITEFLNKRQNVLHFVHSTLAYSAFLFSYLTKKIIRHDMENINTDYIILCQVR